MPAETACPIPGVDRALSSYINSRNETLRIRRTLTRYLTSSLRPVNHATQDQHVNHACPQNITATGTNPPGLGGSRIAYLQALRARSNAEARHIELQASLEDIRQHHVEDNPTLSRAGQDDESTRNYINLLGQRRKVAELGIIQEALEKLLDAKPPNQHHDPRDHIQEVIGEQPDLPAERLEQIAQAEIDQTLIFKLKQEVLEARTRMDRENNARKEANSGNRDQPGLQQQVHALEKARNEIVEWMQGELAKMEEDSMFIEDASPIKRPKQEENLAHLSSAEAQVRDAYERYVSTRKEMIKAYENLTKPSPKDDDTKSDGIPVGVSDPEGGKPVRPLTKLLPHLPQLYRCAQNDRSLLQQAVYLQSQLAASDQELEEALLRLSGESHLLAAGSKDASDWGRVAMEAEAATEAAVREHLQGSKQEASSISAIVDLCSLQGKVLSSV